jgi:hypothetical protein
MYYLLFLFKQGYFWPSFIYFFDALFAIKLEVKLRDLELLTLAANV